MRIVLWKEQVITFSDIDCFAVKFKCTASCSAEKYLITFKKAWNKLSKMNTGKPLAFHECGNVPRVELFEKDECMWSWFMIWHTDYIKGNDPEILNMVYNSEKVITLDELPKELFE